MAKTVRRKQKSFNQFFIAGVLALALTMEAASLLGVGLTYFAAYVLALITLGLFIAGIFVKSKRMNTKLTDQTLQVSGLLLVSTNLWVLVSSNLPMSSSLAGNYIDYWNEWPALYLSLLLTIALFCIQRPNHRIFAVIGAVLQASALVVYLASM